MLLSLGFVLLFSLVQTSATSLTSLVKASGKLYFGSATDNPELADAAYVRILKDDNVFGQLTPGNSMKWDAVEPKQNVFNFSGGDQIVSLARATGKILRGHTLVWYSQLPSWVANGDWSTLDLKSVIENHVRTEVSYYAGNIYAWDVINEPLNDNGTMRADVFYNTLGASYISIALQTAYAADPNAKLYINEYNIEQVGSKIDAMVALVEDLLAAGVPIHGVGFQCHFILGQISASDLKTNMERITALGLEVAVTEFDVRIQLPATEADLEQQRADYMSVVETCVRVSGCVGVTVWDFTDKYSWIPNFFPGYGEACAWNADLFHKPAYYGIVKGFEGHIA